MRFLFVLCFSVSLAAPGLTADLTSREKRVVKTIEMTIRKAGASFQAGEFDEAAESIRRAMNQIEIASATGSVNLYDSMLPAMKRVATAHAMLQLEGVSLPRFRKPDRPEPKTITPKVSASPDSPPAPGTPADGVSFTKQVAPILASRCGRCHIASARGDFSMASFDALMKGPPEGVVIFAGDVVGSRLIETIKTGSMPRGGGKVTPQELNLLETWIKSGAKFDGEDPAAPLAGGSAAAAPSRDRLPVKMATGSETVSFAADVAPLLVDHCKGCHVGAMQDRGGLRMDMFTQLLRGGDSGAIIKPGDGDASLLIQKLRGMGEGERMPAGGRPALPEDAIQLITTWIDEGATLDGASETQPIPVMAQLAWAASATDPQVSERRSELANKNLGLVVSAAQPTTVTTDHFQVIGTSAPETIRIVAESAEEQMKIVRTLIDSPAGESFFHGRATVFVVPRRYDYSEFAKMVERRDVPSDWTSHWKFDGVDAYVVVVANDRDEKETIGNRLLSPLVSLAVATRGGDVPRWFAQGAGSTIAARTIRGEDDIDRDQYRAGIRAAIAVTENAKQFLDGKMTPSQSDQIGAAIMTSILDAKQRKYFDKLIRQLDGGTSFPAAFTGSFGVPVATYVDGWLRYARGS